MVATINNYGGFYSTELYVFEARKHGGIIHAPCINKSEIETRLIGKDIYIGFHLLYSFSTEVGQQIIRERTENGLFLSFNDFIDRIPISLERITLLIRIDAFRFTGKNKRELLWEAHLKTAKTVVSHQTRDLFRIEKKAYTLPKLINTWEEDAFDQIELIGFPLYSPFSISTANEINEVMAADLHLHEGKRVWIKGYLIHTKTTATSNNLKMYFGTFLDEVGDWLDTVHFPEIAAKFPFRGRGIYKIRGKVTIDYGCILIETDYMEKLGIIEDPRYANLRFSEKKQVKSRF
jgi:DNA polymerase-3 subunit alpha